MPKSPPHKKYSILAIGATAAIMVSFLFAANGTMARIHAAREVNRIQHITDERACKRINKLYELIQAQLKLSLTTTPKLAYYKAHPDELARVQAHTHREIAAFRPAKC